MESGGGHTNLIFWSTKVVLIGAQFLSPACVKFGRPQSHRVLGADDIDDVQVAANNTDVRLKRMLEAAAQMLKAASKHQKSLPQAAPVLSEKLADATTNVLVCIYSWRPRCFKNVRSIRSIRHKQVTCLYRKRFKLERTSLLLSSREYYSIGGEDHRQARYPTKLRYSEEIPRMACPNQRSAVQMIKLGLRCLSTLRTERLRQTRDRCSTW